MVKPLLISDNLHSNRFTSAMVPATKYLAERSFTQCIHDLVAERKMIAFNNLVISTLIVIPIVVGAMIGGRHNLLAARSPAVDRRIILNFSLLELAKFSSVRSSQDTFEKTSQQRKIKRYRNCLLFGEDGTPGGSGSGNLSISSSDS